jgi:hypothetical protein
LIGFTPHVDANVPHAKNLPTVFLLFKATSVRYFSQQKCEEESSLDLQD